MANGIIELSPEQLRAQGQEMLQLKNSYESLFQGMISDLRGINGGWSEFLAHNFEGKIAGAQKSFSGVAKMLQNGAVAAGMSANRFSSVDDVLSKFAGGLTLENIAQSTRNPTLISTLQKPAAVSMIC